ncbi:MAG: hypothetical protein KA792_00255 [Bacteroidales bacterium]|nr:hypothetical protein [Bacteroidales bacterium]
MKKFVFYFNVLLIMISVTKLFGQAPEYFKYQAVARDVNGNLIKEQKVKLRITLLKGNISGQEVYTETHSVTSNQYGLLNIEIGNGAEKKGILSEINWGSDIYFIKSEIDITGGTNYLNLGTSQLLSVPYALYAKKAETITGSLPSIIKNDSLVLKDSLGFTRMVFNPNSGSFKMMNKDTVWYEISVKSPKLTCYKISDNQYMINKVEGNSEIFEIYTSGNLQGRLIEERDYTSEGYVVNNKTHEFYAKDPESNDIKLSKKIEEKELTDIFYDSGTRTETTTIETIYNNGKESESTTKHKNVLHNLYKEITKSTETTIYKQYDKDHNLMIDKKTEVDNLKHTKKEYIKTMLGGEEQYYLVEEEKDPAKQEVSKTVKNAKGEGTIIKQTPDKILISNTGSNAPSIEYTYDDYLGKTTIYSINKNQDKQQLLEILNDALNIGTNGNIQTTGNQTNLTGTITNTGNTSFQGTTYHNGTNYFNGNIYGNQAQFNGNVKIGESSLKPGDLQCSGNAVIEGKTNINDNTEIKGSLNVKGDLSVGGKMDFSEADLKVGNFKSNSDISAAGIKKFVIDHPTNPTKLIQHAAIESNEVYNLYTGIVQTDDKGFANAILPDYFQNINLTSGINYQLTIKSFNFVQAIVYEEYDYETNAFVIKTSAPNTEVHWQVTAKRNDNYLLGYPFKDVIDK